MGNAEDYVEGFVCTLDTCSVKEWGYVRYQPSVAGNAVFLVIMALLAVVHVYLGTRYKTRTFAVCMTLGLLTEALGYTSRVLLHGNPFSRDYFLWYLITLTIGPVFLAAAIYLTIGRIVVVHGEQVSRIKPRTYTTFFLGCDVASLVVQAVGGGIAASFPVTSQYMVASLFFFLACSLEFLARASKHPDLRNAEFSDLVGSRRFKMFLVVLFAAAIFLFTRTVFRAVELSEGFAGKLANDEVLFMVLDGAMVILSASSLAVMHPGHGFARRWDEAEFFFRSHKLKEQAERRAVGQGNLEPSSGDASDKMAAARL